MNKNQSRQRGTVFGLQLRTDYVNLATQHHWVSIRPPQLFHHGTSAQTPITNVREWLTQDLTLKAAQQSQGIQTLLEAEKEAAKIVQQARQCWSPPPFLTQYLPYLTWCFFKIEFRSLRTPGPKLQRKLRSIRSPRSRNSKLLKLRYVRVLCLCLPEHWLILLSTLVQYPRPKQPWTRTRKLN